MKPNGAVVPFTQNGQHTETVSYREPLEIPVSDDIKIKLIAEHFQEIMIILGLNMEDDSLKETPGRVAKMYVKEVFSGLNASNQPSITLFENKYKYQEMVAEKNITLFSYCEHHFVPIIGKVHMAYISSGKVIGLSKLHRIVNYYAKRPQVQERLTEQIAEALKNALSTEDVAVIIDAAHLCVASRGVGDVNSTTITAHYSGKFRDEGRKREFLQFLT